MAFAEPILAAEEVQGNVAPGFGGRAYQRLLALRTDDVAGCRRFIAHLVPRITSMTTSFTYRGMRKAVLSGRMTHEELPPEVWVNVAFDAQALAMLGQEAVAALDTAFAVGMARRSYALGDPREPTLADGSPNPGHRSNWTFGGPGRESHIFLVLAGDSETDLEDAVEEVLGVANPPTVVFDQLARHLDGAREHFGFVDGISMPGVRGVVPLAQPVPLATRTNLEQRLGEPEYSKPGQPLVWPGQFVLGYPIQLVTNYREPGRPRFNLPPFARYGSFLVVRRLRQDVDAFYNDSATIAEQLRQAPGFGHVTPDLVRALVVGRWPSGQPLSRWPRGDEAPAGEDREARNYFGYAREVPTVTLESGQIRGALADLQGRFCPVFSHIRKVNPRDLPTDQGPEFLTVALQILRRGIPFGPPYDHGQDPESPQNRSERGLMFLSYQASIERQFEVVNNKWMNLDGGPQTGGFDLLVGQNSANVAKRVKHATLLGESGQEALSATRDWVVPTGGGYFFSPSISSVRLLARG